MTLDDVAGLMRDDAGELRLVVGRQNEPAVDADDAAEGREGIDDGFAQDVISKILSLVMRLRGQPHAELLDIVRNLRILEDRVLITQLLQRHSPDLILLSLADERIGWATPVGQIAARDCGTGRVAEAGLRRSYVRRGGRTRGPGRSRHRHP